MFNNNFYSSFGAFPVIINSGDSEENNIKAAHDCYEVYVNGNYAGRKAIIVQGESARDVENYLKDQGFYNFNASVNADNIIINSAKAEEESIKRNLSIYLNIR